MLLRHSQHDPVLSVLRMCVSFIVALHNFLCPVFPKPLVVNSDNNINNIFLLNYTQHLQRFFTFKTLSETPLNEKKMWHYTHFKGKT